MALTLIKRTSPVCRACMMLQTQLDGEGYEYETIDITEQPEAIEKYGLTSVPVLITEDGMQITGANALSQLEDYGLN